MALRFDKRYVPLWAALPLLAFWMAASFAMAQEGWTKAAPGLPMFAAFGYFLLVGTFSRRQVHLTADRVSVRHGPLPVFACVKEIEAKSISKVYIRWATMSSRSGENSHWAVGIETSDGDWLDISAPHSEKAAASEVAMRIAALLNVSQVTDGATLYYRRSFKAAVPVLSWGGLFIAALLWGMFKETSG